MKYIVYVIIILISSCTNNNTHKQEDTDSMPDSVRIFKESSIINIDSTQYSFINAEYFPGKQIRFGKYKDSTAYSTFFIRDYYNENHKDSVYNLSALIEHLEKIWSIIDTDNEIDLKYVSVGYPIKYPDVLTNQIEAFKNSPQWEQNLHASTLKLDYKLIKKIMLESDVYSPLNNFLKTKGYEISEFQLEKHGKVTKDKLEKLGYDTDLMIPIPFMVWISVERI